MDVEIQMLVNHKKEILNTISNIDWRFLWQDLEEKSYISGRSKTLYDCIEDIDNRLDYLYSIKTQCLKKSTQ